MACEPKTDTDHRFTANLGASYIEICPSKDWISLSFFPMRTFIGAPCCKCGFVVFGTHKSQQHVHYRPWLDQDDALYLYECRVRILIRAPTTTRKAATTPWGEPTTLVTDELAELEKEPV